MDDISWRYRPNWNKEVSPKEKKERARAKLKIQEEFCGICKKRFNRLTCVVSGTDCMQIFYKVNNGKFRGIKCKKFKRIENG
jgi:hypothetical protein